MEKDPSEIAKLTERIAKDPKSKLFVPLAEEYKKAGDIPMAVSVLQEGLRNNPSYVTARSFLGRLLMESGDLPGAQKELEEVIKAIPDNLLAQRKLADLYIYQGRSSDALQRYRAALALNPGDKEIPSLIADIEAGKEIVSRLPKIRTVVPAAAPSSPTAPVPRPGLPSTQPKAAAPAAAAVTPKKPAIPSPPPKPAVPVAPPPAAARPAPAAAPAPAPPPAEPEPLEVIEEIVDLEPIEQHAQPAAETPAPAAAAEQVPAAPFKPPAAAAGEFASFDLNEPAGADMSAAAFGEPDAVAWQPPAGSEENVLAGAFAEEAPPVITGAVPPPAPASPAPIAGPAENDDINTNTLAELYITQGFFEKAIEIYEGMLAEAPGNTALQQKLEKIRAMAGVAERNAAFTTPPAEPAEKAVPQDVFAAPQQERAVPVAAQAEPPAPEPMHKEAPAAAAAEPQAAPIPPAAASVPMAQEARPAAPEPSAERAPAIDRTVPRGPQTAGTRRKETIDRLESWLNNVLKEKP